MKKIEKMFRDFIKNVVSYAKYLMKIDFRELFINVLILICILALSSFVYVPISVVKDLLFSFISIFGVMPDIVMGIFLFSFNLISAVTATLVFIRLFNMRYEDIEALRKQINEKPEKKEDNVTYSEELELPKTKKKK